MSQEFTGNGALPDEAARRRIREDLDSTLFVEAAAGTGKTTALVSRIVSLLRRGWTTLDRVVAVTFTEKAAGELKLRIRELIEEARRAASVSAEEHVRLDAALEHLELARLNTIHGFCSELLRERPVEAHIDPLFDVAGEEESAALMNEAFDRWFEHVVSDPPDGVRRVLRRRFGWSDGGPRNMLRSAVRRLIESRDFDAPWRVEWTAGGRTFQTGTR